MLNVLIVDDEDFVLEGLKQAIEWERFGMFVYGEANNGQEALTFVDQFPGHIDVVITDIKMPIMDGFGLIKGLTERKVSCKMIVLTGHEEFEFAKQAIHYRVFDYLMKPVVLERIEESLYRLSQECQLEAEQKKRSEELETQIKLSQPMLEEQYYRNLIQGIYDQELQFKLGHSLEAASYQAIIAHRDKTLPNQHAATDATNEQMVFIRIRACMNKQMSDNYRIISLMNGSSEMVLLMLYDSKVKENSLRQMLADVQTTMASMGDTTVTFALGGEYRDLTKLAQSYREAQEALRHKLVTGHSSIIGFNQWRTRPSGLNEHFREAKQALTDAVHLGSTQRVSTQLTDIYSQLIQEATYPIEEIRVFAMELALMITSIVIEKGDKPEEIWPDKPSLPGYISQLETLQDIFTILSKNYKQAIKYFELKGDARNRQTITFLIDYINKNLNMEIKLDDLAQKVYLTPNYLGYLFKETMGVSFTEYITGRRMEHAKKLLAEPGSRVNEVALKIGYKNPHYFSKVFKEQTGLRPSDYK
ncbi:response regulator [Paenibacillus luteus]|uniref:response regulator n=1 Tax=Paenibacillus luteus TaxID=2545753 RepID=UPI00114454A9|nr:response regulator [Paenibacillus luteus]